MLNVQLVHWQPGDHFQRDIFCDQVPMMEVCNSCLHPAPPSGDLNTSREFDSTRLNQQLESLALELQAGSEQVQNIWHIWHDSCQDKCYQSDLMGGMGFPCSWARRGKVKDYGLRTRESKERLFIVCRENPSKFFLLNKACLACVSMNTQISCHQMARKLCD